MDIPAKDTHVDDGDPVLNHFLKNGYKNRALFGFGPFEGVGIACVCVNMIYHAPSLKPPILKGGAAMGKRSIFVCHFQT
jgi:hypothetical protein